MMELFLTDDEWSGDSVDSDCDEEESGTCSDEALVISCLVEVNSVGGRFSGTEVVLIDVTSLNVEVSEGFSVEESPIDDSETSELDIEDS